MSSHVAIHVRNNHSITVATQVGGEQKDLIVPAKNVAIDLMGGPMTAHEFISELREAGTPKLFETKKLILLKGHGSKSFFMMLPSIFTNAVAIAMFNSYRGYYVVVATRCDYYNLGDVINHQL